MPFNLFFFGKKDDMSQRYSLKKIPLFSSLNDTELSNILKRVRFVEFRKGDVIYREGDNADAFYIVLSGRCRVYVVSSREEERTLAYLHQGDYFGEVSLLTEKPHAACVEAKNNTMVLKVGKKEFYDLINTIPSLSIQISRRLGMRIKKLYSPDTLKNDIKIITLVQLSSETNNIRFALNFASSLKIETRQDVILIDMTVSPNSMAAKHAEGEKVPVVKLSEIETLSYEVLKSFVFTHNSGFKILNIPSNVDNALDLKQIISLLTELLTEFKYIIVNTQFFNENLMLSVVEQSDLIYVISDSDVESLYHSKRIIDQLHTQFNLSSSEMRLILYESKTKEKVLIKQEELLVGWKIFTVLPYYNDADGFKDISFHAVPVVKSDELSVYSKTISFITREIGGILIGLVLGSGAAFGLAHIGVLKILEKEKIKIDVISGTSIGAVIGSLWASGYSAHEIEKIALSFRKKTNLLQLVDIFDLSLPHFGFFKGRTIKRFLNKYLGKKEFKDLQIPIRIVATDLDTSEDVIFKEGSIVNAVRASMSIPGIVTPVRLNGKYVIDGGVTNPLPVNLLLDEGVHKIIAVNVLPTPNDLIEARQYYRMQQESYEREFKKRSFIKRKLYSLLMSVRNKYSGNLFNVLMSTVQYLEAAVSSMQQNEADIIIHPVVYGSNWAQFHKPEGFINSGETETLRVINDIKHLIEE